MKRKLILIITLVLIFLTLISCSEKIIVGKYRTNFNSYGMFSKTLTLDCNGKVIMNFQGDMQNNDSFGTWKVESDTLIIFFDSIKNQNNKFKGEMKLVIKRNKLEYIPFPKSKYNEIVELQKKMKNDTVKITSYRKVNKITNKNLKNFQGKTGKQYFKKIEFIECN